jgi:Bacteriophage Gp15 protein
MFRLTEQFQDYFEFQDMNVHVDMSFDNILRLFEMFDDPEFKDWEKPQIALMMLLEEYEAITFNDYEEIYQLFKYVMKEFLEIDLDERKEETEGTKKIMDYEKDADLIFASFFAVYKMDLFDLQGKLHWKKFRAMLKHLDDNSAFKQVIGYRTMKIPSDKEASKDYIAHCKKMQRLYALEDDSNDTQSAFDSLATVFKGQAKKGGK